MRIHLDWQVLFRDWRRLLVPAYGSGRPSYGDIQTACPRPQPSTAVRQQRISLSQEGFHLFGAVQNGCDGLLKICVR